jgi:hypothetical protein
MIALAEHTVFSYVFEETKGRLLFLVLYNQANTTITSARAIFFLRKIVFLKRMHSVTHLRGARPMQQLLHYGVGRHRPLPTRLTSRRHTVTQQRHLWN